MCKAYELERYKRAVQPVKFSRLVTDTLRYWKIRAHHRRLVKKSLVSRWRLKTAAHQVSYALLIKHAPPNIIYAFSGTPHTFEAHI